MLELSLTNSELFQGSGDALAWWKWNPGVLCSTCANCSLYEIYRVWIWESGVSADPSENPHFFIYIDWIRNPIKAFVPLGRNISSIRRELVHCLEELLGYYGDGGLQSSWLCSCKMGLRGTFSMIPLWHVFEFSLTLGKPSYSTLMTASYTEPYSELVIYIQNISSLCSESGYRGTQITI